MTADIVLEGVDLAREPDFRLGPLLVSPSARRIEHHDRSETLEPKVMQALVALASRAGAVVSRDALIKTCWEGRIVGDDAINRVMAKLRRLGMTSEAFTLETIPRVGYRLEPVARALAARGVQRLGIQANRRWSILLAFVALLGLGGWLGWRFLTAPLTPDTPVAVLSFRALGEHPAAASFAANADQELNALLSGNKIRVTTPSTAGRRMELSGLVRGEGDRLQVTVQLRDPRTRTLLYSRNFSAPVAEASRLNVEMGWRLTSVLQMAEEALYYRTADFDAIALAHYLRGRDEVLQGNWSMISPQDAMVRRAPANAFGHLAKGMGFLARASYATGDEGARLHSQALAEIERARKLDPSIHWQRVQALATDSRRWSERERLLKAIAPQGGPPVPDLEKASFLLQAGRIEEGMLILDQLEPHRRAWPGIGARLAWGRYLLGQESAALDFANSYLAMRPTDAMLKRNRLALMLWTGQHDGAIAIMRDREQRPSGTPDVGWEALASYAYAARSRQEADRQEAVEKLTAAARNGAMLRWYAVPALSELGALDEAFELANSFAEDPRMMRQNILFDPTFLYIPETRVMREDPRFIALAAKLGLLDFWRASGQWPDFCRAEPRSVCGLMKSPPNSATAATRSVGGRSWTIGLLGA